MFFVLQKYAIFQLKANFSEEKCSIIDQGIKIIDESKSILSRLPNNNREKSARRYLQTHQKKKLNGLNGFVGSVVRLLSQSEVETQASSRTIAHRDGAPMIEDGMLDDREPESRASLLAGTPLVDTIEAFE